MTDKNPEAGSVDAATQHDRSARIEMLRRYQHDLRSPLNHIIGYAEMLEEQANDKHDDSAAADLQKIQIAARNQAEQIDRFFEWVRGESLEEATATGDPTPPGLTQRPPTEETIALLAEDGDHGTILIVDDDPETRSMLGKRLTARGFTIREAEDGVAALALLAKERVDLMLLDVIMPNMGGFELMMNLRRSRNRADLPVIMTTARGRREDVVQALRCGANDYVTKPIDFPILLARIQSQMAAKHAQDELRRMATTDALTGVSNRRYFFEVATAEIERSRRYKRPLSLAMLDVDFFKKVNDTYGHDAGDLVLKEVVTSLRKTLRDSDFIARFGGEEFVILAPETTFEQMIVTGERMRAALEATEVKTHTLTIRFTASFGVTQVLAGIEPVDAALKRADEGLYAAKKNGRNRVEPVPAPA